MNPASLQTNRDLYQFIMSLSKRHQNCSRSLEEYLRALLALARKFRHQQSISLPDFANMLEMALNAEPAQFEETWASIDSIDEANSFEDWEKYACWQIVELRQMERAGTFKDPMRYFGVNSPRGARWYIFDSITYLECATVGSFDGWESGDESGRTFVPGKVAVKDQNGDLICVDPQDLISPTTQLQSISWSDFGRFLWAGQSYE